VAVKVAVMEERRKHEAAMEVVVTEERKKHQAVEEERKRREIEIKLKILEDELKRGWANPHTSGN